LSAFVLIFFKWAQHRAYGPAPFGTPPSMGRECPLEKNQYKCLMLRCLKLESLKLGSQYKKSCIEERSFRKSIIA